MIYTSQHNHGFEKVLNLLKTHQTEYLSGQDLSDVLKISRVAVWKHIKKIRSLGYEIESRQKLGYKLIGLTKRLLPWEISDGLNTNWIGKKIFYFDSIDSTQTYALEIAGDKKENGSVVIAQKQTKGKGRMNRKWVSPNGGIWLSVILQPKSDYTLTTLFPLAASVALADAIKNTLDLDVELKWPNDLLIDDKKIAGILVDASLTSNQIDYIVLGVGINFDVPIKTVEKNIKNTGNYSGITNLVGVKKESNPITLVQSFLYELENTIQNLKEGGGKGILERWTKKSTTIGQDIAIKTNEGLLKGNAIKIDSDGALILKQKDQTHRILVGDVIQ